MKEKHKNIVNYDITPKGLEQILAGSDLNNPVDSVSNKGSFATNYNNIGNYAPVNIFANKNGLETIQAYDSTFNDKGERQLNEYQKAELDRMGRFYSYLSKHDKDNFDKSAKAAYIPKMIGYAAKGAAKVGIDALNTILDAPDGIKALYQHDAYDYLKLDSSEEDLNNARLAMKKLMNSGKGDTPLGKRALAMANIDMLTDALGRPLNDKSKKIVEGFQKVLQSEIELENNRVFKEFFQEEFDNNYWAIKPFNKGDKALQKWSELAGSVFASAGLFGGVGSLGSLAVKEGASAALFNITKGAFYTMGSETAKKAGVTLGGRLFYKLGMGNFFLNHWGQMQAIANITGNVGVFATSFGMKYEEARDLALSKGYSFEDAHMIGVISGAVEGGLESYAGVKYFNRFIREESGTLLNNLILEAIPEGTQEMAQDAASKLIYNVTGLEDDTFKEIATDLLISFTAGAAGGFTFGLFSSEQINNEAKVIALSNYEREQIEKNEYESKLNKIRRFKDKIDTTIPPTDASASGQIIDEEGNTVTGEDLNKPVEETKRQGIENLRNKLNWTAEDAIQARKYGMSGEDLNKVVTFTNSNGERQSVMANVFYKIVDKVNHYNILQKKKVLTRDELIECINLGIDVTGKNVYFGKTENGFIYKDALEYAKEQNIKPEEGSIGKEIENNNFAFGLVMDVLAENQKSEEKALVHKKQDKYYPLAPYKNKILDEMYNEYVRRAKANNPRITDKQLADGWAIIRNMSLHEAKTGEFTETLNNNINFFIMNHSITDAKIRQRLEEYKKKHGKLQDIDLDTNQLYSRLSSKDAQKQFEAEWELCKQYIIKMFAQAGSKAQGELFAEIFYNNVYRLSLYFKDSPLDLFKKLEPQIINLQNARMNGQIIEGVISILDGLKHIFDQPTDIKELQNIKDRIYMCLLQAKNFKDMDSKTKKATLKEISMELFGNSDSLDENTLEELLNSIQVRGGKEFAVLAELGIADSNTKLDQEDFEVMALMRELGYSFKSIAEAFGLNVVDKENRDLDDEYTKKVAELYPPLTEKDKQQIYKIVNRIGETKKYNRQLIKENGESHFTETKKNREKEQTGKESKKEREKINKEEEERQQKLSTIAKIEEIIEENKKEVDRENKAIDKENEEKRKKEREDAIKNKNAKKKIEPSLEEQYSSEILEIAHLIDLGFDTKALKENIIKNLRYAGITEESIGKKELDKLVKEQIKQAKEYIKKKNSTKKGEKKKKKYITNNQLMKLDNSFTEDLIAIARGEADNKYLEEFEEGENLEEDNQKIVKTERQLREEDNVRSADIQLENGETLSPSKFINPNALYFREGRTILVRDGVNQGELLHEAGHFLLTEMLLNLEELSQELGIGSIGALKELDAIIQDKIKIKGKKLNNITKQETLLDAVLDFVRWGMTGNKKLDDILGKVKSELNKNIVHPEGSLFESMNKEEQKGVKEAAKKFITGTRGEFKPLEDIVALEPMLKTTTNPEKIEEWILDYLGKYRTTCGDEILSLLSFVNDTKDADGNKSMYHLKIIAQEFVDRVKEQEFLKIMNKEKSFANKEIDKHKSQPEVYYFKKQHPGITFGKEHFELFGKNAKIDSNLAFGASRSIEDIARATPAVFKTKWAKTKDTMVLAHYSLIDIARKVDPQLSAVMIAENFKQKQMEEEMLAPAIDMQKLIDGHNEKLFSNDKNFISKQDEEVWKEHLNNSEFDKAHKIFEAKMSKADYKKYITTFSLMNMNLKKIKALFTQMGVIPEAGWVKGDYFPRLCNNTEGMLNYLDYVPYSVVGQTIARMREEAINKGWTEADLNTQIINAIGGIYYGSTVEQRAMAFHKRVFNKLDSGLSQFYANPLEAYTKYVKDCTRTIMVRRLFGKENGDFRGGAASRVILELQKKLNSKSKSKMTPAELKQVEEFNRFIDLFAAAAKDYRNRTGNKNVIEDVVSTAITMTCLSKATAAFSQFKELVITATLYGLGVTMAATKNVASGQGHFTLEDLMLESLSENLRQEQSDTLKNVSSWLLKINGFTWSDRKNKEIAAEAIWLNAQKLLKEGNVDSFEYKSLMKRIDEMGIVLERIGIGDKYSLISDLKNGTLSQSVKFFVSQSLSNQQPTDAMNISSLYNGSNSFVRLAYYKLNTVNIKQMIAVLEKCREAIRENWQEGMLMIMKYLFFALAIGVPIESLQSFMKLRKPQIGLQTLLTPAEIIGLNDYTIRTISEKGFGSAIAQRLAPPITFLDSPARAIPIVGDIVGAKSQLAEALDSFSYI